MKRHLLVLTFLLWAHPAFAAFTYYRTVTLIHTQVPSTQTNFPVYITTTLNAAHVTSASGYDIRPYSDNACTSAITTYELDTYNNSTGVFSLWVKITSLSSSVDTTLYLCYGNSSLTTDGSSTSTWDSNYLLVAHMGDASTVSIKNSATGGTGATSGGSSAVAGQIGGAVNVTTGEGVDWNTMTGGSETPSLPSSSDFTASFWNYQTGVGAGESGFFDTLHGGTNFGGTFGYSGDSHWYWDHGDMSNGRVHADYTSHLSAWTYVVMVGKGDNSFGALYFNGSSVASRVVGNAPSGTSDGIRTPDDAITRTIDEYRISKVVRSADWITTEFNNQNAPGSFETISSENMVSGGGGGVVAKRGLLMGVF